MASRGLEEGDSEDRATWRSALLTGGGNPLIVLVVLV